MKLLGTLGPEVCEILLAQEGDRTKVKIQYSNKELLGSLARLFL